MGYQFTALSEDQVANSALTKGGFHPLILPFSQAISAGAVEQIREFVRGGGGLLADIRPGVSDQHGRPETAGSLDDVFGVQHQMAYNAYEPTEDAISATGMLGKTNLTLILPRALCGPSVKVIGAGALASSRRSNIPAFLVNRFGQGRAVLLNFVLPKLDDRALQTMRCLLNGLHLKPLWGIEAPGGERHRPPVTARARTQAPADAEGYAAEHMSTARPTLADFVNGRIHCFGLWYTVRRGIGTEHLHITPPVPGHIYDLKTNRYLGWQQHFEASLPLEDTVAYASVPYRIQRPSPKLARGVSTEGLATIRCLAQLHPDEAAHEKHVVKFRLFAPDGTDWSDFAATQTANAGKAEHRFVLPLNGPHGSWKVEVHEAISGLSGTRSIEL